MLALHEANLLNVEAEMAPHLVYTERSITLPVVQATPWPTFTPTAELTVLTQPTATLAATPTITFPADAPERSAPLPGLPINDSRWFQLALSIIPAGLVVVLALFIGLRALRLNQS